ncbi:MAG TPA: CRTAC1 family protein [Longimicrobiales bacterium]
MRQVRDGGGAMRPGAVRPGAVALAWVVAGAVACAGPGGEGGGAEDAGAPEAVGAEAPAFELVRTPDGAVFGVEPGYTNAWADVDGDGDLDLFVGLGPEPNRLYRNDGGVLVDVAPEAGVADLARTRSAAFGDFDGDGRPDLFVGFVPDSGLASVTRLYRNEGRASAGGVTRFRDVALEAGVALREGSTRQVSWIDHDLDGDLDLFVALRDLPNQMFRNDGGRFVDVAEAVGLADPRRSVGALWWDYDEDGDPDLLVANMDGDANGLFRNDGGTFRDMAVDAGLDHGGRGLEDPAHGTVRPCVADFDGDGHLDVSMANYGPNALFRSRGDGTFEDVSAASGLAVDGRYDACAWADFDHDGRADVYVNGTITGGVSYRDYLFRNQGTGAFEDVTPAALLDEEADHGVRWADFDGDGDPDLALTGVAGEGMHHLFRNLLPAGEARRSLQVLVVDAPGGGALPGAEVRVRSGASGRLLGTGVMDTGSGYNSQSAAPLHFGVGAEDRVEIEVTTLSGDGRRVDRLPGVSVADHLGRWLEVRVDREGRIVREGS